MENLPPDPLLKAGAFIDPASPAAYDDSNSAFADLDPDPAPMAEAGPSTPVHNSSGAGASSEATPRSNQANADGELPDWLPAGWEMDFRVRTSGATAGHKDKYYICPDSNRRFRSKKEVMGYLQTGEVGSKKKKNDGSDAKITSLSNKRKKKTAPLASLENFKFHDVPAKVKWVMTDVYDVSWRPLADGTDRVSETTKQEWAAAFRYLSLQKNGDSVASLT